MARKPSRIVAVICGAVVVIVVGAAALTAFQPWKLWVDDVVVEAIPTADPDSDVPSVPPTPPPSRAAESSPPPAREPSSAAAPATLAQGSFISHEHATRGTARVLRLGDGSRVLRIEGLDTSNGPDLKVWLADAPVKPGRSGWFVFDDGDYVSLGRLKGNIGDQNYVVPPEVDLRRLSSVSIWCDRFNVSFGAAALV